jgi:hypothetical protein
MPETVEEQQTLSETIDQLEKQRTLLAKEIKEFAYPCPGCGQNVRGMTPWDKDKGGECIHCHGWIEVSEMATYITLGHSKWDALTAVADRISRLRSERHVKELRKGLLPFLRFVRKDYVREAFAESIYRMLRDSFQFIAKNSREGFWNHHFGNTEKIKVTLEWICNFEPRSKLEQDIKRAIVKLDALREIREKHEHEIQKRDEAEYKRLIKKLGKGAP